MNNSEPRFYEGSVQAALGNRRATLGISDADYAILVQDAQWSADQLANVYNALEGLCSGTAKVLGLPRVHLTAEYIASCIAIAVPPVNWLLAAIKMADYAPTELANEAGYESERDPVTARKLHAMIQLARTQFESVTRTLNSDIALLSREPETE